MSALKISGILVMMLCFFFLTPARSYAEECPHPQMSMLDRDLNGRPYTLRDTPRADRSSEGWYGTAAVNRVPPGEFGVLIVLNAPEDFGIGTCLSVIELDIQGPKDRFGNVVRPTKVVPLRDTYRSRPFRLIDDSSLIYLAPGDYVSMQLVRGGRRGRARMCFVRVAWRDVLYDGAVQGLVGFAVESAVSEFMAQFPEYGSRAQRDGVASFLSGVIQNEIAPAETIEGSQAQIVGALASYLASQAAGDRGLIPLASGMLTAAVDAAFKQCRQ